MELKKHRYGYFLIAVLLAAIAATWVDGISGPPPDVALGSPALLHVERVVAILIAVYFIFVLVVRSWKGELATKLSKDGFEFSPEALEDAAVAAKGALGDPAEEPAAEDVLTLRLKLEAKLSYIAKHLLRDERCCGPAFVTIGGLKRDKYLTGEEARTASRVMTLRDEELDTLLPGVRGEFLRNADKVVSNLRASVFYGLVWKLLAENDWTVTPIPTKRKRADLHATRGEKEQFRVVPRYAMEADSSILKGARKRLEKFAGPRSKRGRILVVVPDRSDCKLSPEGDLAVIKLADLKRELGLDKDPRSID